ncbi:MAG: hypothetical protein Q8R28_13935, partial [Dehalococcoidia bacterium]|nr:hypothetical protein [Dehalococcoidia bacterium]
TQREEELTKEGWAKKFTACEPKLSEYVKLYGEMGFEVLEEKVNAEELCQDCNSCFMEAVDMYRTIYTRPKKG